MGELLLDADRIRKSPDRHVRKVIDVRFLTESTYRIRCERGALPFKAGQCANLGYPGVGINREYSTYSGESDPYLDFLIREIPGGIVSVQLKSLRPGDDIEVHGFYGDFCIKSPDGGRPHLFVGTGTGIAPFHSFVRSHPQLDYRIVHGVRHLGERYDREDYPKDRYTACVSAAAESGAEFRGRVTDYLSQHAVEPTTYCYLCGNRAMISAVYELLREQGVPSDNIFAEAWY